MFIGLIINMSFWLSSCN